MFNRRGKNTNRFDLELLLVLELALVQPAELVDLVLVLPSDLDLVAGGLLVFFRELQAKQSVSYS